MYWQAILSPFSHKLKECTGTLDDNATTEIEKELESLQAELGSFEGVGDEEPQVNDDADEIAPDVAASDAAAVRDAIYDANSDLRLTALTIADANIGRISIAKVRFDF